MYMYPYTYICILIELPKVENPASTSMQHTEHWTAVSTLDPGFERPAGLATLKSSDRTKQSVCG